MVCPACSYSNLEGADLCEGCGQALTDLPTASANGITCYVAQTPIGKVPAPATIMVSPTTTIAEVVDRLVAANVGCVLVVSSQGRLDGIFSERDLLMKVAHRYDELKSSPVRDFMTADPETLPPDATVAWALNRMDVGGFRHIPIVEDGRPLAVVSVRDLLRHLATQYVAAQA